MAARSRSFTHCSPQRLSPGPWPRPLARSKAQPEQLNAPVLISTRQTVIALQNRAGVPLADIKLTVVAYGNTEFTRMLGRMETEESREVNLNQLSSRDGTSFNARLSKPKLVRFTATDVNGKPVDLEVAWK